VLALPQMQAVHQLTDDDLQRFCRALEVRSTMLSGSVEVADAQRVLLALGQEALTENTQWLLLRRGRPLELHIGG